MSRTKSIFFVAGGGKAAVFAVLGCGAPDSVGVLITRALFSTGSSSISASFICETPKILPFAVRRGLRKSADALSARPSIGEPQSQSEITRLRCTPAGRGGAVVGASPLAIRSVQSANALRWSPNRWKKVNIDGPDGPYFVRVSHFSRLLAPVT